MVAPCTQITISLNSVCNAPYLPRSSGWASFLCPCHSTAALDLKKSLPITTSRLWILIEQSQPLPHPLIYGSRYMVLPRSCLALLFHVNHHQLLIHRSRHLSHIVTAILLITSFYCAPSHIHTNPVVILCIPYTLCFAFLILPFLFSYMYPWC